MPHHVLIGFAEALSTPEVIFSLRNAGHRVSVFARQESRLTLATHLPIAAVHRITAPEADVAESIAGLKAILTHDDAPTTILALDDAGLAVTDAAFANATPSPRLASATGPLARVALDKIEQIAHARAAGFTVPDTTIVRTPTDLNAVSTYPAIAKPALAIEMRNGRIAKSDTTYLPDRAARDDLRARLPDACAPLLVQPLIDGTGEGVFGFATPTGIVNWSGHRRIRMMNPHGSGSSACESADPAPDVRAMCADFLARIAWRGPFMVELLRGRDGTPYFIELNGRMWGSMALARRAGFEYPSWAVAQAHDASFVPPTMTAPHEPLLVRHLGRDLLHILFVLRGAKSPFHAAHWPKLAPTLRQVLRPARARDFYNYDAAHPRYFLRDAYDVVSKALFRA